MTNKYHLIPWNFIQVSSIWTEVWLLIIAILFWLYLLWSSPPGNVAGVGVRILYSRLLPHPDLWLAPPLHLHLLPPLQALLGPTSDFGSVRPTHVSFILHRHRVDIQVLLLAATASLRPRHVSARDCALDLNTVHTWVYLNLYLPTVCRKIPSK